MSEAPTGGAGGKVIIAAAVVLLLGLTAAPIGIILIAGLEDDELAMSQSQTASCTGPNGGQALAVTEDGGSLPTVEGYDEQQMTLAATIMQVAEDEGLDSRAQLIGLITVMQESALGKNPTIGAPNGDGDAGPFQQRQYDGWYGSLEQVNDPVYAATAFFTGVTAEAPGDYGSAGGTAKSPHGHLPGLVDIESWQYMPLGDAAQKVQKSDYPDAYADHIEDAQDIMTALSGVEVNIDAKDPATCSGEADELGDGDVKTAIETGRSLLGTPYEFGGGGTHGVGRSGIDCSGFTQYMFASVGIDDLPRTAQQQYDFLSGNDVKPSEIKPGDLIFYAKGRTGTVGSADAISHVAVYSGDGKMIESTRYNGTEPGVQEISAEVEDGKGFVGVRRVSGLS